METKCMAPGCKKMAELEKTSKLGGLFVCKCGEKFFMPNKMIKEEEKK